VHTKKFLLLYCSDQEWLQAMAYALRVHGYDVTATADLKEALALAAGKDTAICAAVLLHARQGDPTGRLVHLLLEHGSHVPMLLVDRAGDLAPVRYADMVLYGRNTSMAHILAALKLLCARKRRSERIA
jgi:DNA-binding response OmpR family regulator